MKSRNQTISIVAFSLIFAALLFALNFKGRTESKATTLKPKEKEELQSLLDRAGIEADAETYAINVWATWCSPCLKEIPELNQLREEFATSGVSFIALTDESAKQVEKFFKDKKKDGPFTFSYQVHPEQDELIAFLFSINPLTNYRIPEQYIRSNSKLMPKSIPLNVIIHRGEIIYYQAGYSPDHILEMKERLGGL